ncbi:uncharacterized protein K441DRAFT_672609 [Cenococcum geophilum 1.58]|uniref:uncharacterized protein n=1 Tax=Cenococcum geophilum 1.58 TaxID=794803 RepID=UPI00358FC9BD|nr:hypothetical protein K441DRAFT_672609 [Cenococcum geophilum 1.58]
MPAMPTFHLAVELFPRGGVLFLRKDVSASVRTPSGSAGRKDAAAADAFQGRVLAASFSVIFGCPGMSGRAGQNKRSSQGWLSASGKRMLLRNSGHRYLGAPKKTTLNSIGRSSGTRNEHQYMGISHSIQAVLSRLKSCNSLFGVKLAINRKYKP